MVALLGATALAAFLLSVFGSLAVGLFGAVIGGAAILTWLWRQPVRGLYVLLAAAVVLEEYTFGNFSDDIGRYVPFFEDIATWTNTKGIPVSIAELFMVLIVVIWLLKDLAARRLRFDKGTLMRPLGLYMLMVLIGEIHGLTSGGDFRISLWEIRSQVYLFVAYVLACNLVTTRKQVGVLVWILMVGTGLKGLQGTWRYLVTLRGQLNVQEIFPHEQAFFYGAFITFTPILFLYGGSRRLQRLTLLMLPLVVLGNLANQRRASIVALGAGIVGLFLVTLVVLPARRRLTAQILLALAVMLPPYYITMHASKGILAEPARAIGSAFTPDARDAGSNQYRINEDADIMFTMKSSPLIGFGFGKEMATPYPLADLSNIYVWWKILPHDSILWVWMRLGTIGFLLLWFVFGTAIVQAARLQRLLDDPRLKGLALLIMLLVIEEIVLGYLDLQWTNYRNLITMGVLFALIGKLTTYARPAATQVSTRSQSWPDVKHTTATSSSLAVVDGCLARLRAGGRSWH